MMDVKSLTQKMDDMVSRGDIVNAIKEFFAEDAKTSDYGGVKTSDKSQMINKMQGFVDAIAKVNGITHHRTLYSSEASASEFTFDFDMKDGSKILWHEVITRLWSEDGKVIREEYFETNSN